MGSNGGTTTTNHNHNSLLTDRINFFHKRNLGDIMLATHVDAERRYEQLRKEALQATSDIIQGESASNVKLRTIDSGALNASKLWEKSNNRHVDWG